MIYISFSTFLVILISLLFLLFQGSSPPVIHHTTLLTLKSKWVVFFYIFCKEFVFSFFTLGLFNPIYGDFIT